MRIAAAMQDHAAAFLEVCRVGGGRFSSQKRSTKHRAGYFVGSLRACFGILVEENVEGMHPCRFVPNAIASC